MPTLSPDGTVSTSPAALRFRPTVLSAPQIAGYCFAAGFTGAALVTAIAIALAESGGKTDAHNSYSQGGRTYDVWGLFQISTIHATAAGIAVNASTATDPMLNAKMAYDLSGGGQNWLPWSTYSGPASQGYDGAYLKFIPQATEAAKNPQAAAGTGTDPTFSTGDTGVGAADTPTQYAFAGKTTVYPAVAKGGVWRAEDISTELVAANGTLLNMAGLKSIPVGGSGTVLADLLVSADVAMDNSQSTQVTLTFQQGDKLAALGYFFPADPATLISRVKVRDLDLAVSSCSLTADAAGRPQLEVKCITMAMMLLMNAYPPPGATDGSTPNPYNPADVVPVDPSAPGYDPSTYDPNSSGQPASSESADDYMNRMCKIFNIPFYAETDNTTLISANSTQAGQPGTANYAGYNPFGNPGSGSLPDSLWTYFQRLAGKFGFWVFEASGAIWFAQPHQLADWGNKLHVNYRADPNATTDGTEPIGTPQLSANIEETPGGFARVNKRQIVRQISVQVAPWYGCQARPGDELVLSGFWSPEHKNSPWDTNTDAPDHWAGVGPAQQGQWPKPGQKYIITSVHFAIDGGLTPVTIAAQEVQDPDPQIPLNTSGDTIVNPYDPNAPLTGYQTTAYVRPVGVEKALSADSRTARRAADALFLALSQQGIQYQWGGTSPQTGFDCSGLVYWACVQVGVDPTNQPRTSQQLWATISGAHRQISVAQALNVPFALLFPADPASAPTHVAISVGDGKNVLQAPSTGQVVNVSPFSQNSWLVQAGLLPSLDYSPPPGPAGQSPDAGTAFA